MQNSSSVTSTSVNSVVLKSQAADAGNAAPEWLTAGNGGTSPHDCAAVCLPWSYDQIWRMYQKAAKAAKIGGLRTHSLRHTYRSWLDSVGTPVGFNKSSCGTPMSERR